MMSGLARSRHARRKATPPVSVKGVGGEGYDGGGALPVQADPRIQGSCL